MLKSFLLLLFFLITSFVQIFANNLGSVRGKVTDRSKGTSVVGAKILVILNDEIIHEALTNDLGIFEIPNIEPNTYNIECRINSYRPTRYVGVQISNTVRPIYFRINYDASLLQAESSDKKKKRKNAIDLIYTYASVEVKAKSDVSIATLSNTQLLDIPATGYWINSDEIQQRGYTCLLDALADVPEFEIQEKSNVETHSILAARGAAGNGRFLILQDGIRINSLVGTDLVIFKNISLSNAKTIEIIVGPASSLYGADAFIGVINIITFKGNELKAANLTGSYGSFNTTENTFSAGYGQKDWAVAISGNYYKTAQPFFPKYYPTDYAWYNEQYLTQNRMRASAFDNDTIQLTDNIAAYALPTMTNGFRITASYKNLDFGANHDDEYHSSVTSYRPEFGRAMQSAKYGTTISSAYIKYYDIYRKWTFNTSAQATYWRIRPFSNYADVYARYKPVYKYGFEKSAALRQTATYNLKQGNNYFHFTLGTSFQYSNSLAETCDLPHPYIQGQAFSEQGFYYPGSDTFTYEGASLRIPQIPMYERRFLSSFFLQSHIDFGNKLSLYLGNRYDVISLSYPAKVLPAQTLSDIRGQTSINVYNTLRIGLVSKPANHLRLKAFFGEAFLSSSPQKTLNQVVSFVPALDSANNVIGLTTDYASMPTVDYNALKPERLRSFEVSAIYTKNNIYVSANAYYNIVSNILLNQYYNNIPFYANPSIVVPEVDAAGSNNSGYVYGFTVKGDYEPHFDNIAGLSLKVSAAYSLVDGQFTDNNLLNPTYKKPFFTAKHTLKTNLTLAYKRFSLHINSLHRSTSYNEGTGTGTDYSQQSNAPFTLFNLFSRCAIIDKTRYNISLFTRIQNVFDIRYYHTGNNDVAAFNAVPQNPRSFLFGITAGVSL